MKLGTHCVLYAQAIADDLEGTLKLVEKSGCDGVEIGARFFGVDRAEELRDALQKYDKKLAAVHTLLKVSDLFEGAEETYQNYKKSVEFAKAVGTENICSSGMVDFAAPDHGDPRFMDYVELKKAAGNLNKVVKRIYEESGIRVNYHNHVWEFDDDGRVYKALLTEAPDLHFCMDTGWVCAAGYDPVEYIRQYSDRFSYFHLRDLNRKAVDDCGHIFAEMQKKAFSDMGEGDMDLPVLFSAIEKYSPDAWGVVEYEFGDKDPTRYMKAVAYCKGVLDGINGLT